MIQYHALFMTTSLDRHIQEHSWPGNNKISELDKDSITTSLNLQ